MGGLRMGSQAGARVLGLAIGVDPDQDLIGTSGADTMTGGSGNDYIDGDRGNDLLSGGDGDDVILGGFGTDYLSGGAGNDQLSGEGHDSMAGGAGDDTYYIGENDTLYWDYGTVIEEGFDQGTDTVVTFGGTVFLRLTPNVENIVILGIRRTLAEGNDSANSIIGNDQNNSLNGMGGADRLEGRGGNDQYYVDDPGDVLVEAAGKGRDTVNTTISFTLRGNFENLTLLGADALSGKGNGVGNVITGNAGANTLFGMGGADTMNGGAEVDILTGGGGGDVYILGSTTNVLGGNTWDTIVEIATGGIDTVYASADVGRYTYQLEAYCENLVATGVSVFRLWGNELDNALTGNAAANVLDGFAGSDTLTGGLGADQFTFSTPLAGAVDTITDFVHLTDDVVVSSAAFGGGLVAGGAISLVAGADPAATLAAAQMLYNTDTGQLSFDADGTGSGVAVQFALLNGLPALSSADFIIVA